MDRNQRSRRQKSANGSYAQQSRRSMGSRLGLEKRNAPRPKAPPEKAAPTPHVPPRQRPAQEINPQKAGYRPGTPRRTRRVTQAEIIRAKRRRRLLGALLAADPGACGCPVVITGNAGDRLKEGCDALAVLGEIPAIHLGVRLLAPEARSAIEPERPLPHRLGSEHPAPVCGK